MDKFKKKDTVYVSYHNVYLWLFKIFQPPACGEIICKHWKRKRHHFAERASRKGEEGFCDWYWVKCVNCIFPILIPELCIMDLAESIERDKIFFERMGKPDLLDKQRGAYERLRDNQLNKELYL